MPTRLIAVAPRGAQRAVEHTLPRLLPRCGRVATTQAYQALAAVLALWCGAILQRCLPGKLPPHLLAYAAVVTGVSWPPVAGVGLA